MKVASPATLARLLQARLAEDGDPTRAMTLDTLLGGLLPYPFVRTRLDLAGKGEYDLAMLGFLGSQDLIKRDPAIADAVERELRLPEPGLGFVTDLGDCLLCLRGPVELGQATDRSASGGGDSGPAIQASESAVEESAVEESAVEESAVEESPLEAPDPNARVAPTPDPRIARESDPRVMSGHVPRIVTEPDPWVPPEPVAPSCWGCREPLPDRATVRFCPSCGVSQADRRCPECGDRVEGPWGFCVRCGARLGKP